MSIKIAVIGGTGMGKMLGAGVLQTAHNLFGSASYFKLIVDKVDKVDNIEIIFLDRHHQYRLGFQKPIFLLPHQLKPRAYMCALAEAGVKYVIATSAVGGINGPNGISNLAERSICMPSDFVDLTQRPYTFACEDVLVHETAFHRSPVDMFCSTLRGLVANHVDCPHGILSCVQGPRYETPAEVRVLRDVYHVNYLGMTTAVPEAILAREAGMHYLLLANVTNMPLEGPPADGADVHDVIAKKQEELVARIKALIHLLSNTPPEFTCECTKTPSVFEMCERK